MGTVLGIICGLIFWFFIILICAFKQTNKNNTAQVEQIQGLYIFMFCKPISEYQYIGSVSKSVVWTGRPDEMLNTMINKVKKDFPTADGLIFTDTQMTKVDAIKFK